MRRAIAALALTIFSSPAHADETYVPPDFLSATPPLPASMDGPTTWRLSLTEAVRIAVRQNLDVQLERLAVEATAQGAIVAGGQFEPVVSASYRHSSSLTPPSSTTG